MSNTLIDEERVPNLKDETIAILNESESTNEIDVNNEEKSESEENSEYEEKILNDSWILWYHDPNDLNWDISSYKIVSTIKNIRDFWNTYDFLKNHVIENSMFFIMLVFIQVKKKNNLSFKFYFITNYKTGSLKRYI